jgi:hypothetical protein
LGLPIFSVELESRISSRHAYLITPAG